MEAPKYTRVKRVSRIHNVQVTTPIVLPPNNPTRDTPQRKLIWLTNVAVPDSSNLLTREEKPEK
jgi:hypothetical protein